MKSVLQTLEDLQLSPDEVAKRTRLPVQRVRELLAGADATLADLRALSRGLRIPLQNFADSTDLRPDLGLLFRTTTKSRSDLGAEAAYSYVTSALKILPERVQPPRWLSSLGFKGESMEEAQNLSEAFRQRFAADRVDEPLIDLPQVLDGLDGIVIARLETSRFEGASVIAGGYAFVFVSPRFPGRMLFTLAHELGHLIAHHGEREKVVFDLSSQIGSYRPRDRSERFVDAFASNLLMPSRGIAIALKEIRSTLRVASDAVGDVEILFLARLFGVSFDAAALRCETLDLLPRGGAASLSEHLKKNFSSPEKRATELGLPPRQIVKIPRVSSNLLKSAIPKIESGEISIGWVTDKLDCTANDIYSGRLAAGATDGYRH